MVRKTVNDLARSCDDASYDDHNSGACNPAGSTESISRSVPDDSSAAAANLVTCPRCKRPTSPTATDCSACGFSFQKTCVSPAGAPAGDERDIEFDRTALLGSTIAGKYRVVSILGEGGFGVVYKVEFLLFDERQVFALKLLHPRLSANEGFRRRFHREARLAMALAHESAIQVREFGQTDDGLLYYTMDYCDGESLKDLLARESILSVSRALSLTRKLLTVVQAAHEHGIVHRDLKPENIFVTRDVRGRERVKVGDFGLAKTISLKRRPSDDITHGGIVGSPRYMSPEQARGADVDGRSDVYSIALVAFEMLYGTVPVSRPPASGASPASGSGSDSGSGRYARASGDTTREFSFDRPRDDVVPDAVYLVLTRALATNVDERFASAEEFRRALDDSAAPRTTRRGGHLVQVAIWLIVALSAFYFAPIGNLLRSPSPGPGELADHGVQVPSGATNSSESPVAIAGEIKTLRIEDYAGLRAGTLLEYDVMVSRPTESRVVAPLSQALGHGTRLSIAIEEKIERGRYRARIEPGGQIFFLRLDHAANTLWREFSLPNPETGELEPAEPRVLLRLPRTSTTSRGPGYRASIGGREIDVAVNTGAEDFEIRGRTFRDCVEVVETDPVSGTKTVRYYQRGRGEVATQVFEAGQESPYFSRVIAD